MVDVKGPRWGVALGTVFFAAGYYPIAKGMHHQVRRGHQAETRWQHTRRDQAPTVSPSCASSPSSPVLEVHLPSRRPSKLVRGQSLWMPCSLTGPAALNFPESRGTATAFPLAAFGLSAFFFATVALAFPHSTYNFLLLLATGTVVLPVLSFFFLRVVPPRSYHHLPRHEPQVLHRTKSSSSRDGRFSDEPGAHHHVHKSPASSSEPRHTETGPEDENSSLLSNPSVEGEDMETSKHVVESDRNYEAPHLDIRGFALLPHLEFWQLFCMLGLMTGIGLMTIKYDFNVHRVDLLTFGSNIGNDAQALWRHYDDSTDPAFIEKRQTMHVSILSFCSFVGRLSSGIGSDLLVSKLSRSRFWCLFVSALIFCAAQVVAIVLENPHFLFLVSGLTGLAYGILFGVYPSLVAHCFGVHGLSQNWGTMTLAPVISGNVFNLVYGRVYDRHSVVDEDGARECLLGRQCYTSAYWVTFGAAVGAVGLCLWSIWHENEVHKKDEKSRLCSDHERTA